MKTKLKRILDKIDNFFEKYKKVIFFIILGLVLIGIYILNFYTQYTADDFTYRYIYGTTQKVSNIGDIFVSQYHHYFSWGGRSVVHFFVQLFMMLDKNVFNIINAIAYIIFIILLYFHSTGKKEINLKLLIIINFLVAIFQPAFGQSFLWLTGSCNYLWGGIINLLFLLPYRVLLNKEESVKKYKQYLSMIGMFILGILAGWTNENSAAAMIVVAITFIIITKLNKIKLKKWQITGLIGAITGFSIMILAPGNYVRDTSGHGLEIIEYIKLIISRGIEITKTADILLNYIVIIFLIFMIVYIKFSNKKIKNPLYLVYLLGALVGIYSMVVAPFFPRRAYFGVVAFIIIAIGIIVNNIKIDKYYINKIYSIIIIGMLLFVSYRYYAVLKETVYINNQVKNRILEIEQQKAQGIQNIQIDSGRIIVNKYEYYIHYEDCYEDSENWINKATAVYYEVESITVK